MSSWLISRPRYLNLTAASVMPSNMRLFFLERKGGRRVRNVYFSTLTRRHIGAARTRDTSPAAISNCAS